MLRPKFMAEKRPGKFLPIPASLRSSDLFCTEGLTLNKLKTKRCFNYWVKAPKVAAQPDNRQEG